MQIENDVEDDYLAVNNKFPDGPTSPLKPKESPSKIVDKP
jgi:hypothetical protein